MGEMRIVRLFDFNKLEPVLHSLGFSYSFALLLIYFETIICLVNFKLLHSS